MPKKVATKKVATKNIGARKAAGAAHAKPAAATAAKPKVIAGTVYRMPNADVFYKVLDVGNKYATCQIRHGRFGKYRDATNRIEKRELLDMAVWKAAA